ncbi:MAG TPA: hypothetical protein VFK35_11055 [Candidatus Limnocylindrales bacterium]|nr:hypothetical protein [Candidatus Limnocylindrales bacterium]
MTTIFFHASAVRDADATDRLAHLVDAGHELVLLGGPDHPALGAGPWSGRADDLPVGHARGAWFVTADPATCGDRQAGLRTILIGPRPDAPRPTRCDQTARDLRDAVLEILAADAMS